MVARSSVAGHHGIRLRPAVHRFAMGALADRFGARKVTVISLLLYAICLFATPFLIRVLPFWLVYFVTSILGAAHPPSH